VPDNHPHRPATVEDHSAHFTHYTILTRDEWRDKFASMGLIENLDLTKALDKRYRHRDWVMRFFAYTKGA